MEMKFIINQIIKGISIKELIFVNNHFFVEILLCRSGPDIDIGGGCCFSRWLCWLRHFPIICCSYKHLKSFYCLYNAMSIISMILWYQCNSMTVIFNRVLCTPEVRNFVGVSVITFWCFVAFCCLGKHCLDSHPPSHPPANCSLADTQTQNQITKKRRNITKMRACLMLMRDGKMLDLLTIVQPNLDCLKVQ